jgi:hypothetical protein
MTTTVYLDRAVLRQFRVVGVSAPVATKGHRREMARRRRARDSSGEHRVPTSGLVGGAAATT